MEYSFCTKSRLVHIDHNGQATPAARPEGGARPHLGKKALQREQQSIIARRKGGEGAVVCGGERSEAKHGKTVKIPEN